MSDSTEPIVCKLGMRNPAGTPIFSDFHQNFSESRVSQRLGKRNKDSGTRLMNESKFFFVSPIYLRVCLAGFCCKKIIKGSVIKIPVSLLTLFYKAG